MRRIAAFLATALLASCAVPPAGPPMRSAKAESRFQELVAGKVARPSVSCLPNYRASSGDMTTIDENTVVFQQSSSRIYVAHMQGSCTNLGVGPYALVTRPTGAGTLCRGDIAEVVDTMAHTTVGSCVFGDFTPYVRPGA